MEYLALIFVIWDRVKAVSLDVGLGVLQRLGLAPYRQRLPDMSVICPWSPRGVILLGDR